MTRGKYIVLEGPEGVGKTTQLLELARRLQAAGLPVRTLREPDSQSDLTARAIRQLTQDPRYPMNTRTEVLLYNAARAQSLDVIRQSIEHGVICLVDRNYLTTLAIQYYGRGDVPDYETINRIISFAVGGMEPDLCILLDAPVAILRERLSKRYNGERFDNLDDAFLERVRSGYLWEAHQRQLPVVFATDSQEQVAEHIWQLVSRELAVRSAASSSSVSSAPTSVKEIIQQKTLPTTEANSSTTTAAAQVGGPAKSLPDTSSSNSVVLEDISALLAMRVLQGRLTAHRELQHDEPTYYTPDQLKPELKKQYTKALDAILELYQGMQQKLSGNDSAAAQAAGPLLRAVLPLAITTSISLLVDPQALDSLGVHLLSQPLPEARDIIASLQAVAGDPKSSKQVADYRVRTDEQLAAFVKTNLAETHSAAPTETVTLIDFWPKNELVLVADMLYEHSNLALEELQSIAGDWPYNQKNELFKTYIGKRTGPHQHPGRALEKAHYSWDIICDFMTFRALQGRQAIDDLSCQPLTPRHGYEVPKIIEDLNLAEQYESCFDISLKLYSALQQAGYREEAQYAVLQGHKLRCKLTYNAREAFGLLESISSADSQGLRHLKQQMREKISEVHPLTAEAIRFTSAPA